MREEVIVEVLVSFGNLIVLDLQLHLLLLLVHHETLLDRAVDLEAAHRILVRRRLMIAEDRGDLVRPSIRPHFIAV